MELLKEILGWTFVAVIMLAIAFVVIGPTVLGIILKWKDPREEKLWVYKMRLKTFFLYGWFPALLLACTDVLEEGKFFQESFLGHLESFYKIIIWGSVCFYVMYKLCPALWLRRRLQLASPPSRRPDIL